MQLGEALAEARALRVDHRTDECLVLGLDGGVHTFDANDQPLECSPWPELEDVDFLIGPAADCPGKGATTFYALAQGQVWPRDTDKALFQLPRDGVIDAGLSADGEMIALLFEDEVQLLNSRDGELLDSKQLDDAASQVTRLAFGKDHVALLNPSRKQVAIIRTTDGLCQEMTALDVSRLESPSEICFDSRGHVLVAAAGSVFVFALDGTMRWSFHDNGAGVALGHVLLIAADGADNVFVVFRPGSREPVRHALLAWALDEDSQAADDDDDDDSGGGGDGLPDGTAEDHILDSESLPFSPAQARPATFALVIGGLRYAQRQDLALYVRACAFGNLDREHQGWQRTSTASTGSDAEWKTVLHLKGDVTPDCCARVELWHSDPLSDSFVAGTVVTYEEPVTSETRWHTLRDARGQAFGELEIRVSKLQFKDQFAPECLDGPSAAETIYDSDDFEAPLQSGGETRVEPRVVESGQQQADGDENACERDCNGAPADLTSSVVEQLVRAVKEHTAFRRLQALGRLARSSQRLQREIGLELGLDGFRTLVYKLEDSRPKMRESLEQLLGDLLRDCSRNRAMLVQSLDWPCVVIADGKVCVFYTPWELRQTYAARCTSAGRLTDRAFLEFLRGELGQALPTSLAQEGVCGAEGLIRIDLASAGGGRALAFSLEHPSDPDRAVAERVKAKSDQIGWAQGTRIRKLFFRFQAVLKQEGCKRSVPASTLRHDAGIGAYINLSALPVDACVDWHYLRTVFSLEAFQARQPGALRGLLEDVELKRKLAGVQGRSVEVIWVNRRKRGRFDRVRILVHDKSSGRRFECGVSLGEGKDALREPEAAFINLLHLLRFPPGIDVRAWEAARKERGEEDPEGVLMLRALDDGCLAAPSRALLERQDPPPKVQVSGPGDYLVDLEALTAVLPDVAAAWNRGELPKAASALLEATKPLVASLPLPLRECRLRLAKTIKYVRVEQSKDNVLRLWRACERVLREASAQKGVSDAKPESGAHRQRRRRPAAKTSRELAHHLVRDKLQDLEKAEAKRANKLRCKSNMLTKRQEARRKERLSMQDKRRKDEWDAACRKAEAERREQEELDKQFAAWYRDKARLCEMEAIMRREHKQKEADRLAKARKRRELERVKRAEAAAAAKRAAQEALEAASKQHQTAGGSRQRARGRVPPRDAASDTSSMLSVPSDLHFDDETVSKSLANLRATQRVQDGAVAAQGGKGSADRCELDKIDWEAVLEWPELAKENHPRPTFEALREIRRARRAGRAAPSWVADA